MFIKYIKIILKSIEPSYQLPMTAIEYNNIILLYKQMRIKKKKNMKTDWQLFEISLCIIILLYGLKYSLWTHKMRFHIIIKQKLFIKYI